MSNRQRSRSTQLSQRGGGAGPRRPPGESARSAGSFESGTLAPAGVCVAIASSVARCSAGVLVTRRRLSLAQRARSPKSGAGRSGGGRGSSGRASRGRGLKDSGPHRTALVRRGGGRPPRLPDEVVQKHMVSGPQEELPRQCIKEDRARWASLESGFIDRLAKWIPQHGTCGVV